MELVSLTNISNIPWEVACAMPRWEVREVLEILMEARQSEVESINGSEHRPAPGETGRVRLT